MSQKKWSTGTWVSPSGTEWAGLFGSNKSVPVALFSDEERASEWEAIMNSPKPPVAITTP